jgi:hypothetical protein
MHSYPANTTPIRRTTMAKDKDKDRDRDRMTEKVEKPKKVEKPEKVKKHQEEKVKKSKKKKARKADEIKGIASVDLMLGLPDEPPSCSFEPVTGHLTLRIPQPLDGQPGAQGPQGPQGPEGANGPEGAAGSVLDLSRAPGDADTFFLFVDEAGRLAYSANGAVSFVSLMPANDN